jgi:hypothetical protein
MSAVEIEIEHEAFHAHYDFETQILHVCYRTEVTPTISAQFYQWLMSAMREHPTLVSSARGSIYDFRTVENIATSNISSATRQSQQVNQQVDLQNHPVALIARDAVQERLLSVTMKISPQTERKRIVRSEREALAYIDSWHQQQNP